MDIPQSRHVDIQDPEMQTFVCVTGAGKIFQLNANHIVLNGIFVLEFADLVKTIDFSNFEKEAAANPVTE